MQLLTNPVRRYAWGSTDAIPRLLGRAPDGSPQAELWIGAHERDSSRVGDRSLAELLAAEPDRLLGPRWSAGARLPFLAKLIAVAEPLSLQVHPGARLAREGYLTEERAGVHRDSALRSFPDDVAKTEMVYAVSRFHALCGFRPLPDLHGWLRRLDIPALRPTVAALDAGGGAALRPQCAHLLTAVDPADIVPLAADRCTALVDDPAWASAARPVLDLARRYPADPASSLALLLRPVVLPPGGALRISPGQPHTYLSGTAFEVQANSDNVLRAGLTGKHTDVPGVVRALDTDDHGVATVAPYRLGPEQVFPAGTDRFALSLVDPGETKLEQPEGPQVLCCLDGEFEVADGDDVLRLAPGRAAFAGADCGAVSTSGEGTLLRVTPGRAG